MGVPASTRFGLRVEHVLIPKQAVSLDPDGILDVYGTVKVTHQGKTTSLYDHADDHCDTVQMYGNSSDKEGSARAVAFIGEPVDASGRAGNATHIFGKVTGEANAPDNPIQEFTVEVNLQDYDPPRPG
ncbi:hypothetical protein [Streptomyces violascens]|uniref:hypothetical protein n=1 Tax=Streptomyces violascens TaxID=67381 RepID=UPI0036B11B0C